jgi:hypothetical protein
VTEAKSSYSQTDSVFYDRYRIKSDKVLGVKVAVVIQVKRKKKKKEIRTAALGGVKRLNRA